MNANLRALGLALVAVLAIGAVAASTASAADLHFEEASTILLGEEIEEAKEPVEFAVPGGAATCKNVSYSAVASGATLTEIAVTPKFPECSFGTSKVNVKMNGCTYLFKVDAKDPKKEDNSFLIKCPTGAKMELQIVDFPEKGKTCTLKIAAQQIPGGLVYTVREDGPKVDVDFTLTAFEATYEKEGSFICLLIGNGKDLSFSGVVTVRDYKVKGEEEAGEQLNYWIE